MMQASGELVRDFSNTLSDLDLRSAEEFRQQQQIAVVVVMFTDIEGSTNLLEAKGEIEYSKLRHRHDELVRLLVEREGAGRCIKHLGDGFMILFAEPSTAVERALEVHDILARESELRIRIGMDMGQVALEKVGGITRDAFGRFVNRAARINSAAKGGQTLVSYNVWDSAIGWLAPQSAGWRSVGELLPKGFTHPIQLYEFYSLSRPPVAATVTAPPVFPQATPQIACASCGKNLPPGSKFCGFCGATSSVVSPKDAPLAVPELPIQPSVFLPARAQVARAPKPTAPAPPGAPPLRPAAAPLGAPQAWRIPTLRLPVFRKPKTEKLVRRQSPAKLLWIDETPEKTAFARQVLGREGWNVEAVRKTTAAFAKMLSRKYRLIVLVTSTTRQGLDRMRFLKLIHRARFRTPAVLFSNLQTSQRLGGELKALPMVRCTTWGCPLG